MNWHMGVSITDDSRIDNRLHHGDDTTSKWAVLRIDDLSVYFDNVEQIDTVIDCLQTLRIEWEATR